MSSFIYMYDAFRARLARPKTKTGDLPTNSRLSRYKLHFEDYKGKHDWCGKFRKLRKTELTTKAVSKRRKGM